jgi:hypothetical protein
MTDKTTRKTIREQAIHAAVIEMSLFTGNLEMKVRKAIERYEWVLQAGLDGRLGDQTE